MPRDARPAPSPAPCPAPAVLAVVALGGAAGATLRHVLDAWAPVSTGGFGWTTFAVNVTGSFLLALLPALAVVRRSPLLPPLLGPGVLGGFTTLSAVSEQTRALLSDDRVALAATYSLATLLGCLGAVALADRLTRAGRPPRGRPRGGRPVTALSVVTVALAAGLASVLRFLAAHHLDRRVPWGTIAVNVVGSFVIGVVAGSGLPEEVSLPLATGFCGGLTTYSAFAVQTHDRGRLLGPLVVALTLPPALLACALGFALGAATGTGT